MDAAHIRITKLLFLPSLLLLGAAVAQAQTPTFQFPNGTSVTLQGLGGGQLGVESSGTSIAFTTSTSYASTDAAWLNVNNGAAFSGSTGDNPSVVTLFFQLGSRAGQLTPGVHTATVNLTATDTSGASGSITVSYDTNSTPGGSGTGGITASPTSLTVPASTGQSNVNVQLSTANATPISFTAAVPSNVPWLTVTPTAGTVTSGTPTTITATFNPNGLANSSYSANIVINYGNTTLNIPVTYNVGVNGGGTGGTGTLIVNPTLIPWSFTSGGTSPGQQFISIASSGSASTYSATVTSSNNWLQINGATNSVPLSSGLVISPTSNIYSLATGQYTGTVSIMANDGSTATVTVNLTVNGSTSTGISISPNPVNFSATLNGPVVQQQVTVTSSVQGSISASVTGSGLSVASLSSGTINQGGSVTVTISGNPAGLGAQTVIGSLTITVNGSSNNQLSDQINFTVGNPNSGGGGTTTSATALSPSTLNFAYQTNSSMPLTQTQQVYLSGTDSFAVSYPAGQSWITVTPASGVAPGLLNVMVNASTLPAGNNSGTVTFTGASTTVTLAVNLLVTTSAVLYSGGASGDLYFPYIVGSSAPTLSNSLLIYASDNSNVPVTATVTNPTSTPWLGVGSGSSNPMTPTSFSITITPTSLANGLYQGSITLTSGAANNPVIVPVILSVSGGVTSTGSLTLSSSSITFPQVQVNGAAPAAVNLQVSAANTTSFSVSATTNNNSGNWLSVSPSGAVTTNATLSVTANQAGLVAGTYTGQINLIANGITQTVGVTLVVGTTAAGGSVTVATSGGGNATAGLTFSAQAGVAPVSQTVTISSASGSSTVPFTVSTSTNGGGNWLQTSAPAGSQLQTQYNLTVSVVPGSLAAGNYSGTITVSPTGGNAVQIPVSLTVTGVPSVVVSATPLSFAFQVGQQNPANQSVQVSAANASSVSFTAQASSSGWLSVLPISGTAPGGITVSVNPSGLSAGTFTGNIIVTGSNGAAGSITIPVTLTVTAPLPTVTSVVSSATSLEGPIAPGEIVSIYGTFLGPTAAVTLTLANGKVSTNIGGVQVYIGGYAAPLIFVSANQINAVVPYEAANLLNPSVLVLYLGQSSNGFNLNRASSVPGIFTANSSGTGPGAILNGDNSFNGSGNPAARGSIVQVFLTGEGATSPAGVTGAVTAVTSAGQLPVPVLPVAVLVNNQPATATFAGEAPGLVAGVLQVNVQIPAGLVLPAGSLVFNAPLVISIGGNSSQSGVTVAVK